MKNRCIVIIPSYKPQTDFIEYANELSKSVYKIIVINDGSGEEFNSIFNRISEIENVVVISYLKNMGKGYALKQGFNYAINNFSDDCILVTADCDGQHKIKDIFKVYETAIKNENALILGSRDFTFKNVPKKSKMGNAIMRKTFNFFYGGNVYDTQTGLRAFSNKTAYKFTKVKGNRFEYELALLIFAQKNQIEIIETKIETVYASEPSEHKTHFNAVKDSLQVFMVMIKNVSVYFLSTIISGIIDIGIFALLSTVIFKEINPIYSLVSVVVARVSSSFINYLINFKFVFKGRENSSLIKYYTLWLLIMGLSYTNVVIFGSLFKNHLIVVKLIGDLILGAVSYEIQCKWVFNSKMGKFHGVLANVSKTFFRLFTKKYKTDIKRENKPVVYVCRHLNMHGAYTTLKTFDFDLHPLALSVFFDEKEGYNHLKNYTFSKKKNKKIKSFSIRAKISAWFLKKLLNSLKAVPVYRKSNKSILTLKKSLDYLVKGESLIVFPDIDYVKNYDTVSDIYDGFLLLGEMYKKKTGDDLAFIPLFIDEKNKRIIKKERLYINDFKNEREEIKSKLIKNINHDGLEIINFEFSSPIKNENG